MASFKGFFQLAYVVDDLDVTMQRWLRTTKLGPFFVRDRVRFNNLLYRGEPTYLEVRVALCQMGDMQLELIQQTMGGRSAYRDSVPAGLDAFHHIGGLTHDFDGQLEEYRRAGVEVAAIGYSGPVRFAYLDTRASFGNMTELIDYDTADKLLERFQLVADSAESWDGTDPIRPN